MKITSKKIFKGRNIYSHKKCIRIDVDLEGYAEIPSKDIEGFNEKLLKYVPELYSHRCGIDVEGGFVIRLNEGTYLTHICEHTIIALQNKLGIEVSYGKAREVKGEHYYLVFQYIYERTALKIAELSVKIINSLIKKEELDFDFEIDSIKKILDKETIGPSTSAIKKAAESYGLPVFEIGNSGYYQIGYGRQKRLIEATISSKTSCLSADIACDKALTKTLLLSQNIPVANGIKIFNKEELLKEAEYIGYPLVLKPQFGNQGNGIILNIKNKRELLQSYNRIKKDYKDIILERYLIGNDYRVCVVNGEVVAASKRIPPYIIGNGISSVKELIEEVNKDKRRGEDHEKPLTKIKIDKELLKELKNSGVTLDSVIKNGESIILRRNANISTGGVAIDCTEEICDENKEICKRAAKIIGLDICGIDITTKDISKPLDSESAIIEVNAAPGIRMHHHPSIGESRDVGNRIINYLYDGDPKNIPIISVTGTNGKTTTTRLIAHTYKMMGLNVGMTSTEGIFINDECIDVGDDTGFESAMSVLLNGEVDVAVLETARGGILKKGLAYDIADVGVLTNITEDHLGIGGIDTLEELSFVKSLVLEAVKEEGYSVINADDLWSTKIIKRIKNKKIYFSKDKDNALIKENISKGEIAVSIDEESICVWNNFKKYKVLNIKDIPITLDGKLSFNIENSLGACAALVGMGIDYCMIAKGFKSFYLDSNHNKGRFNIYEVNGRSIILDYGHNIEGYRAVFDSLKNTKYKKIIGVVGVPGDRSDESLIKVANLCSEFLDNIIIKEDIDRRGREKGEVSKIIKSGIALDKLNKTKIILDELKAMEYAYSISEEGDTIICFFEEFERLESLIKKIKVESLNTLNKINLEKWNE
ncbi:cyanophycin synthetase [Clostridium sp. LY3-2]|uniref:cyanophycin synthetase n=1 Tax=Clostridium sp. LY3-2 TaxID=2942482 RepID=UPI0021537294|nr:cyanophycin synthetase [Clostridium sp. LY3-2]MCR6516127.1 cyanophycin synthetase [Clostridium sp. LY3-2]